MTVLLLLGVITVLGVVWIRDASGTWDFREFNQQGLEDVLELPVYVVEDV